MKKLLLTGFEPFFSFTVNRTMKIVKELDGTTIGKYEVTIRVLSVDFAQSEADTSSADAEISSKVAEISSI